VVIRHDVSAVPPQGGYVAKQCPVRAQWDLIRPGDPLPPSPLLARRLERGRHFEAEVVARLLALHQGACTVAGTDRAGREAATVGAMKAGAPVILGGRLPADLAGRRVGEPDLLVPAAGGDGYRPVDIKQHRCLDAGAGGLPALCSPLDRLSWEAAEADPGRRARKRKDDLLQLAHYQRMLEAAGMASAGARMGGIIGVDGVVTWYDLDAADWLTPSAGGRPLPVRSSRSRQAATHTSTAIAKIATVTSRLPNSIHRWIRLSPVAPAAPMLVDVQAGQSGQPRPDWLSRTAAPVRMIAADASTPASAIRRMEAGEGARIAPAPRRARLRTAGHSGRLPAGVDTDPS